MENVLLATAIAGVTELLKRIHDKDYRGAIVIALAAGIGALAGALNVQGLTVEVGVITGLGIAGIHTIATRIGSN
jgi:hypothetical protein